MTVMMRNLKNGLYVLDGITVINEDKTNHGIYG